MHETLKEGRYVLLGPFAEGAQGKTYDAVDKLEGRAVVVKRMEVRGAKTWKELELAEREANVLRSLSHPKLPAYFDHFEEDGALFLVMEKIEGESLGAMKRRKAVLSEKEVRRLLSDSADILRYLHRRTPPVIHRDLKPGNVLRRPDGSFAFVDFGAVRDKLKPEGGSTVVGTFGYMAPEQFQGRALPTSDVYAIGATALTMLTGQEPEDLPHKGLGVDVHAALGKSVSAELVEILSRMLEPDPDKRAGIIPSFDPRQDARKVEPKRAEYTESRERDPRQARKAEKKEAHRRRKEEARVAREERRAQKKARREHRRDGFRPGKRARGGPPWPISMVLALGVALVAVVVAVALKVVVPLVLRTLSLFVATDGLRRAAQQVSAAGDRASLKLREAIQWTQEADPPATKTRIQAEEDRVRVGADHESPPAEAWDEEEDHEAEPRARRQR
jgi:hypothetical protein